jgi:hypothetical protein
VLLTEVSQPDRHRAVADETFEEAAIARASAEVALAEAQRVQDYTVSGGVRYLRETGDVALVSGITIPIGRFDRNQGNIERARADRRRLEFEAEADRLERLRRLVALRAEANAARLRADAIKAEVLPRAVRTLDQIRDGYRRGGFAFRDVQDAADAIVEVQESVARSRQPVARPADRNRPAIGTLRCVGRWGDKTMTRSHSTSILAALLAVLPLAACGGGAETAAGEAGESAATEPEKGPHRGRMLRDGDFALEMTVFEDGVPPKFRVFPTKGGEKLDPAKVDLTVTLRRLDGEVNVFKFKPNGDWLDGQGTVVEPHSFDVEVVAVVDGKRHVSGNMPAPRARPGSLPSWPRPMA